MPWCSRSISTVRFATPVKGSVVAWELEGGSLLLALGDVTHRVHHDFGLTQCGAP